jgi:hypothetical protein
MRKWYESLDFFVESNQSRAGHGRVRKKITGQGRIQVIEILAGQVTGYKNTLTCRALGGD